MRSPIFRGDGVADAGGQPVVLIPGFLAGDDSLAVMTHWLRRTGHRTRKAGIRSNVGCSQVAVERLAERVETVAETSGRRVALIGQSRGGNLAKVLGVRYPQFVSGVIALGSPQLDPLDVHPFVRAQVYAVGALGSVGMPGLFRHSCRYGACCERFWEDLRAPLRKDVGYLSIYSRTDGIVNCAEAPTGKHLWSHRLDTPSNEPYAASPLLAEGRLYLVSEKGTTTVLKLGSGR